MEHVPCDPILVIGGEKRGRMPRLKDTARGSRWCAFAMARAGPYRNWATANRRSGKSMPRYVFGASVRLFQKSFDLFGCALGILVVGFRTVLVECQQEIVGGL